MREFVAASGSLSFTGADREEIYGFVEGTWQARQYLRLSKKDKGVVRRYLAKISGRSLAVVCRFTDSVWPAKKKQGPSIGGGQFPRSCRPAADRCATRRDR